MRIGIYARVSTRDQNCDLRVYCTVQGFDLVREYVDVGRSGVSDSRPELNILMDDDQKRQFGAVVCWRFNRFARCTKHLLSALEEFRSLGIQFISYQENIDTSCSALGQALITNVLAVAKLESELLGKRVTSGIRNARANGKSLERPRVKPNLEEILLLRGEGHSLRKNAAKLVLLTEPSAIGLRASKPRQILFVSLPLRTLSNQRLGAYQRVVRFALTSLWREL